MKVNNKLTLLIIACISIILTGCQSTTTLEGMSKRFDELEESQKSEEKTNYDNIDSYKYESDSRFKVVHKETIEDGTTNGVSISILVDRDTNVMYMQTVKFQAGYGLTLEVMVDKNGEPLLYENDI